MIAVKHMTQDTSCDVSDGPRRSFRPSLFHLWGTLMSSVKRVRRILDFADSVEYLVYIDTDACECPPRGRRCTS